MNTDEFDKPLLIFGATGGTGVELVRQAVAMGFAVNAFSRSATKAADKLGGIAGQLQIIEGDASQPDDVERAFATSPVAVVTSLGIYQAREGGEDLTRATGNIVTAMHRHHVTRLVNISSLGVGNSYLQGNFVARLVQKTTLKHTLSDKEKQEQLLRESGLDVTNIRPSRLMNGSGPHAYATWEGPQPDRKLVWAVNRSDVAEFALSCLNDTNTFGKGYVITGSKS